MVLFNICQFNLRVSGCLFLNECKGIKVQSFRSMCFWKRNVHLKIKLLIFLFSLNRLVKAMSRLRFQDSVKSTLIYVKHLTLRMHRHLAKGYLKEWTGRITSALRSDVKETEKWVEYTQDFDERLQLLWRWQEFKRNENLWWWFHFERKTDVGVSATVEHETLALVIQSSFVSFSWLSVFHANKD